MILIDSCNVDSHGNHERLANIYLEALPAQIIIQNSRGFDFAPHYENPAMQLIRVNPKLDLDGPQLDVAAYRPGLLRYEIGTENVFIPDGGSGVTDRGFPQQLWPYVANRVEAEGPPTAGVWRTNQVVWSRPNASAVVLGWRCVAAGRPGRWRPIAVETQQSSEGRGSDDAALTEAERLVQVIRGLAELWRSGAMDEEEFAQAKAAVLAKYETSAMPHKSDDSDSIDRAQGSRLSSRLLNSDDVTDASDDTTCRGALINTVSTGGTSSADGWVPAKINHRSSRNATLSWDPTLSHNGSAGSLQVVGGAGKWTTNLDLSMSKGKIIRLSFFRHTTSRTNSLQVAGDIRGVATDGGSGKQSEVIVERNVASAAVGWQLMTLGDFRVPASGDGNVSLSVRFEPEGNVPDTEAQYLNWNGASLNLASFSCQIVAPNATSVQSTLTKIASSQAPTKCSAWHAHSSARVYNTDVPVPPDASDSAGAQPIRVYAGRNERVMFQVAVRGPCAASASANNWQWSALAPAAETAATVAIPKSAMTVREVKDVEVTFGFAPHGRLGSTPEFLAATNDSGNGASNVTLRTFWFKLTVPADAPQGNMTSTVKLRLPNSGGVDSEATDKGLASELSFVVQLEVGPPAISIPSQPSIDIYGNLGSHTGPVPPDEKTFAAYYGNLWEHRVFTGPDMTEVSIALNPDDTVNVTSTDYERELGYIAAHSPFRGDTVGSKGGQWVKITGLSLPDDHGEVAANATWLGIPVFTDATNSRLTARFKKASSSFLSQCFSILRRHGVGDRGMIKMFDEPRMWNSTVNALIAVANHIKAVAKAAGVHVRLRVSGGVPTPELAAAYAPGVWDMGSDDFPWYKGFYPAARANGVQITLYNNGVNLLSQPLLRTRTFFWELFQQRLSGALCWWSVSAWGGDPPDFSAMFNADMGLDVTQVVSESGVLILPPRNGTKSRVPLDTLRWEQTLLGLQDYELLFALKQAVRRASTNFGAGATRRQKQAMTLAQSALEDVHEVTQGLAHVFPANDITYTLDVRVLDRVRRNVQNALVELHAAEAAVASGGVAHTNTVTVAVAQKSDDHDDDDEAVHRRTPRLLDSRNASNAWGVILGATGNHTGYSDQPQVVFFNDSYWLCVLTASSGHEGQRSQIAASTISRDKGRSWSAPVSIEPLPPTGNRLAASWVNPLLVGTRLYVFYTFNLQNTTQFPDMHGISNSNLLGGQFYRYSDDAGVSWSERREVPIRSTQIDRQNPWNGSILQGWSVGKPFISRDNVAYLQYTKIGCPPSQAYDCDLIVNYDEAWLFASKDLAQGAARPHFETLPEGDVGLISHNRTRGSESARARSVSVAADDNAPSAVKGSCYMDCPPSPANPGGCHHNFRPAERQLQHQVCTGTEDLCAHLTRESCGNACVRLGYHLAGVEAGHQCMCAARVQNASALTDMSECSSPCTGDSQETCGGKYRAFVFNAENRTLPHPPPNRMPGVTGGNSWIAEEGDLVEMGASTPAHLYYVYRTSDGFLGVGTSTDGGRHFAGPLYAEYEVSLRNTSGRLKNPRGPITPRRFENGRYLLLYFNRANGGISGSRNPYFLSAGRFDAKRGTILWSQPELILYTHYSSTLSSSSPVGDKLGYPDLFERDLDGKTEYWMTETDKQVARIHKFDGDLIADLFAQGEATGQPHRITPIYSAVKPQHRIPSPLKSLDITAMDSLTIEAWVRPVPADAPARPVLACGQTNGTGSLFHFFAPGSRGRALAVLFRATHEDGRENAHAMETEQITQLGVAPGPHQVVLIVDGDAQIATFMVDGVILDGADELGTGFVELAGLRSSNNSTSRERGTPIDCSVGADVLSLRVYGSKRGSGRRGFLRTSEVVASYRAGHDWQRQSSPEVSAAKTDDNTAAELAATSDDTIGASSRVPYGAPRFRQSSRAQGISEALGIQGRTSEGHLARADSKPLSVLDFGALGDGDGNGGGTDNTKALQDAIDAAQAQGRSLFVPAGRFMVNSTLVVGCSEAAATCPGCPAPRGCGAGAKRLHPLHLFGEGQFSSVIATVQPLHAVIEFAAAPSVQANAGGTDNHHITDMTVDGGGLNACVNDPPCGQANFSIYAASITRSTFARLNLVNAKVACLSLAYGWINRVTDSLFAQCMGVGLHLTNECNNADVQNNNYYGNGLPIVIQQAAQILIQGNVIEGNQGPAIVATDVEGLTISSNYFEANNRDPKLNTWELSAGRNVTVNADIVLNGAMASQEDDAASYGYVQRIGSTFPCRSVIIQVKWCRFLDLFDAHCH